MGASIDALIVSVGIRRIFSITLSVSASTSISVVSIIYITLFYTGFYIFSIESIYHITRSISLSETDGPTDRELLSE